MPILSSRPDAFEPSDEDLLDAIKPTINLINWIAVRSLFPDGSRDSVQEGQAIIQEVVSCFMFPDFAVRAVPSTPATIMYEVAIRPYEIEKYVTFRATLRVKP